MDINRTNRDLAIQLSKGIFGAIPTVGPLAALVIDSLIPNQRIDRIADFLMVLEEKVSNIEEDLLKKKFTTPESIDLLEDSFYQVCRALSEERKQQIAALFKNSLTDYELEHVHYKKLLSLLGELNDVEILLLKYYSQPSPGAQDRFWKQHERGLDYPRATAGTPREDVQVIADRETLHHSYETNLVRIGLLGPTFRNRRHAANREFAEDASEDHEITTLGRLLLRSIDEEGNLR